MDPDAVPDDRSMVETGEVGTALKHSFSCFGVFLTSSWVLMVVVFFVFVFFVMVAVLSILLIKKNSNN